uniref:uncharacterized protein LOC120338778 isoform X2 n=1 Tax=Styela clava TaxID=7725 RepID=UPI0019399030|nr:uncharacterized protein LOC120338778 isoform X2 [Styela clava]
MANQGQPQEGANNVNIQDAHINELHAANVNRLHAQADIVQVGDIQQAHAEFIHADNVQNLHVHYDNDAPPPPAALQPQLQHDAAFPRTMQEEMPSTSGYASSTHSTERRNVNLEMRNEELLVAGESILSKGQNATTIIRDSVFNIMGGSQYALHPPAVPQPQVQADEASTRTMQEEMPSTSGETTRAQKMKGSTDAKLASDGFPCPVYEIAPIPSRIRTKKGIGKKAKRKRRKHAKKFIKYFNKRTLEQTKVKITEDYKQLNLNEPDFEVNPQLREVPHFYRGEMAPKTRQYNIETGFTVITNEEKFGKPISHNELIEKLGNKKYRYIAILGQAGGGKTTSMKRLARTLHITNKLGEEAQAEEALQLEHRFEFIHHLNIKDIPVLKGTTRDEAISPFELLFGKEASGLSPQELEEGYERLQQNQSKSILFLDGLDQATWTILGKHNKMKYTDKSSTATVMYNIITGNLFPDMTIVISSREFRVASLPSELRPQFITALAGLAQNDIKRLFIAIIGDSGEKAWEKLTVQSPALIPLSSVPLFLIFNAIVCKDNPDNPPDTMTEVMLQILHIFMRSDHAHKKEPIEEILQKLMQMSFEGTKEKRVIFTIKDLEKVKLSPLEVRDFVIKVPGKNMFNQHLMEGDHLMFFSHQILQEVLSALYISNMDSIAFRTFIETEIRDDHWAVIRRFLSGNILNPDIESSLITNLSSGARQDDKREILRKFLAHQSSQEMESYQKLELFGTLYEANDTDLIRSCIKYINFHTNPSLQSECMQCHRSCDVAAN